MLDGGFLTRAAIPIAAIDASRLAGKGSRRGLGTRRPWLMLVAVFASSLFGQTLTRADLLKGMGENSPFDVKRLIYGGFKTVVSL